MGCGIPKHCYTLSQRIDMRKDRQKYKGHEVLKVDQEGAIVARYDSMHIAQEEERVSFRDLESALDSGRP